MMEPCIHFVGSYIKRVTRKDLNAALIFSPSHASLLGCSLMCDKALKIIRSKFNREENPINTGIADLYFLKGTCVGIFFFFLHFSVQPQFSPRKNSLIILSRESNWLQLHGGSSTNESHKPQSCCVLGFCCVIWEEQGDGFRDLSHHPHKANHSPRVSPHRPTCSAGPHPGPPAVAWRSLPSALTRAGSVFSLGYLLKNWILAHRGFSWPPHLKARV